MDSINNDMSQSVTAERDFQIKKSENQAQDKEVTVNQAEEANANQAEAANDTMSSQGVTLSISEAGRAASSADEVVLINGADEDAAVLQEENEGYFTETDSGKSTINLSIYTETELKQMYLNGEITKVKYDEELMSRGILE